MLKRLMLPILFIIMILSACGGNDSKTEDQPSDEDTNTSATSEETEANMEEDEATQEPSFTPFQVEKEYTLGEDTLETVNDDYEEYPNTSLQFAVQADDGSIYYIKNRSDYIENNGVLYEFYTVNEDGSIEVTNSITSPTLKKASSNWDYQITDQEIYGEYLITKMEHSTSEQGPGSVMEVTVEISNLADAMKQGTYEAQVALVQEITYDSDMPDDMDIVVDFGSIVNTTDGPVFLYADSTTSFKGVRLTGDKKEFPLQDPYDLTYTGDYVKYIDFGNGYYFAEEVGEELLKRLEMETGEPLYDGANDKVVYIPEMSGAVYPADDHSFFLYGEDENGNPTIVVISHELELLNTLSYTGDNEDGLYDIFYLGNNKFMSVEDYEYQRKNMMKIAFSEYIN